MELFLSRENGLTDQEITLVKQTSEISKHLIDVTCQSAVRSIKCNGLKCAAHLGKFMVNGKEVLKCRECPYPEIIYRNREGDLLYTPVTVFVKDKNDFSLMVENAKYVDLSQDKVFSDISKYGSAPS
mgnify:CR=1 FL=1